MRRLLFSAGAAMLLLLTGLTGCKHQTANTAAASEADAKDEAAPTVSAVTVTRGAIQHTLPVTGTFAVLRDRQAAVTSAVASSIDQLLIHAGQQVARGQVIVQLSTRALQGQIQQANSTIAQNQIVMQQAQVNVLQQQAQAKASVAQAASTVAGAQASLAGAEATLAGARANLAGAKATLAGNIATARNAQQNLTRAQTLFKDGLVARKDVEAAQLALSTAQAQVDAQRQAVAAQEQTVTGQETAVKAAQASGRAAQASDDLAQAGGLQTEVKKKDVEIAQQQIRNARGALATAKSQMALYTLRAPLSGLVTNVGVAVGETIDTTRQIATIANLDVLQLQIAIPSISAAQVRTGQTFTFRIDTLPNQVFRGRILSIGVQVDPTNSTVIALAQIPNPSMRFRDSMSARVWIVTEQHANTLLAPKGAVFFGADGKASVVQIGADNVAHTKDVKVGLSDDNNVEILSGISPGARLATTGGSGLPDGTKVVVSTGETAEKTPAP